MGGDGEQGNAGVTSQELFMALPGVAAVGLAYGAGPCNISCLPYLGPLYLAGGAGSSRFSPLIPFSLGRLSGYTVLGAAAGLIGETLAPLFKGPWPGVLLGLSLAMAGFALARRTFATCGSEHRTAACGATDAKEATSGHGFFSSMYLMGAGMTLTPCAPFTAALTFSAATATIGGGAVTGLAFGAGAVVVPSLTYGYLAAPATLRIREGLGRHRDKVEKLAVSLMIFSGAAMAVGAIVKL